MLTLRCSTRNFKGNLLLNTNFNHFLRFHCSNLNISRIVICKLLIPTKKYGNYANLHRKQQSAFCSSFPINGHSQNDDLVDKQKEIEPNLAQLGPKLPKPPAEDKIVTLRVERIDYVLGNRNCFLLIAMKSDENGNKWIDLSPIGDSNCQKIPVPNDAYLVLNAMDILLSKSVDDEKPPICHELVKGGLHYDYKLEIRLSKLKDQIEFLMTSIPSETQPTIMPKRTFLPIELFPQLRDQIAEMLTEFDGTQEIGPRQSPLPKWLPTEKVDEITTQSASQKHAIAIRRESLNYTVDVEPRHRMIILLLQEESGNKSIKIVQEFYKNMDHCLYFILFMPIVDVHQLLNGMETLLKELRERSRTTISPIYHNRSLVCRPIVTRGLRNDYKLEIHLLPNKQLDFKFQTVTTGANMSHREKYFMRPIPIHVFHWMKDQLAKMLADCGEFNATVNNIDDSNLNYERNFITLHTEVLDYVDMKRRKNALLISLVEKDVIGTRNRFIRLNKKRSSYLNRFANIFVPQDAYLVVKAMDKLMSNSFEEEKLPICHELVTGGLHYDYKLEIIPREDQFFIQTITSEASPTHKPRRLFLPIHLLPLFRDKMAKLLREFDRTEEIEPLPHLPKWIPAEIDQQTALDLSKELIFRSETLEYKFDLKPQSKTWINIMLEQGQSGHKFIHISQIFENQMDRMNNEQKNNKIYYNFPNIRVPENAYPLLNAMCALQNDLEEKYQRALQQNYASVICRQVAKGSLFYDYKLEIYLRNDRQLEFRMQTITTEKPTFRPKRLEGPIPIHVLHWLKNQIAEMLIVYELEEIKKKKLV